MTESTIYTHNKVYSYLTSYLIAAGTTEVVLDLSATHRASKVCARVHKYVCACAGEQIHRLQIWK